MGKSEDKLKLLVLCQLFYPELISTGQTLTELCERLSDMGMEIKVLCGPPTIIKRTQHTARNIIYKGMSIKRVWGTRFPKLSFAGRVLNQITYAASVLLYMAVDRSKSPVLVLTNPPFLSPICALINAIRGRPYIYLVFDVYPDTAVRLGYVKDGGVLQRLWDWSNGVSYRYAENVVVIGRCMKEVVSSKCPTIRKKIRQIHVWSDDSLIGAENEYENPFISKWGIEGKFVVGYSGNMGSFHDMETLMQCARILNGREDIVFLFIGDGKKKVSMIDYARHWGLENCIFKPYVEREDLGYALSCSDIGLVSLDAGQEGLSVPSKTFGLMAAGVPVLAVVPDASEIAMVIREEECGRVIKPGDAGGLATEILRLKANTDELRRMGAEGRRAVKEKYNVMSAANEYYRLIKAVNE